MQQAVVMKSEIILSYETIGKLQEVCLRLFEERSLSGDPLFYEVVTAEEPREILHKLKSNARLWQATDELGNTLLHVAALFEKNSLADSLLRKSLIDIDQCNLKGLTILHLSAFSGNRVLANTLLDLGASNTSVEINIASNETIHCNALHIAVIRGHLDLVQDLLERSQGNIQLNEGGNLLHLAILGCQNNILNFLLSCELVDERACNQEDSQGRTPLSLAAQLGNIQAIHLLSEKHTKVNKNYVNQHGQTALHFAVIGCQVKSVKHLLREGVEVNILDSKGKTPLELSKTLESDLSASDERQAEIANYKSIAAILKNVQRVNRVSQYRPKAISKLKIRNLVFQGGGPKGLAYLGAIQALEEQGSMKFLRRIAGTSAGAITAVLVALNYNSEKLKEILLEKSLLDFVGEVDVSAFTDEKRSKLSRAVSGVWEALKAAYRNRENKSRWDYLHPLDQLMKLEGLCDGRNFLDWIEMLIQNKLCEDGVADEFGENYIKHLTFGQLHHLVSRGKPYNYRELFVVATCVTRDKQEIVIMNSEDPKWAEVVISDAIRASMAIPGFFTPHQLRIKRGDGQLLTLSDKHYLDGGMLKNYPIDIFDKFKYIQALSQVGDPEYPVFNEETYGFSLFSERNFEESFTEKLKLGGLTELTKSILSIYWEAEHLLSELFKNSEYRTIYINNLGVGLLEFNLPPERKFALIKEGYQAVIEKFFNQARPKFFSEFGNSADVSSSSVRVEEVVGSSSSSNSQQGVVLGPK